MMPTAATRRALLFASAILAGLLGAPSTSRAAVTPTPPPAVPAPAATQDAAKPTAAEAARQQALADAETRLEKARVALAAAQDALEQLVRDLADDYEALTSAPGSGAARNALVLAMADSLEAARARIDAAAAQGRALLRPSRTKVLAEVFEGPVRASSTVDERLAMWVARQVADALGARSRVDEVQPSAVRDLVDGLFVPDETWPVFWNRAFHQALPEADAYTAAMSRYEEAGVELDRLRFPERYGPRGEPAPPGMLVVPGGQYVLGPNSGWARPQRKRSLDPFAIDRHEVTHREYAVFVDAQPTVLREDLLPRGWSLGADGRAVYDPALRQHPVVHVDWGQAAKYAAWAGKRLPTEDEWEAAAAGTAGLAFPWGNAFKAGMCNGAGASLGTMPVESFPHARAPSGCYDMAGNVWEWTSTLEDGTDVDALPEGLVNVAIRGGSWRSDRAELATRARWTAPGKGAFGSPTYDRPIGFRCAMDLP